MRIVAGSSEHRMAYDRIAYAREVKALKEPMLCAVENEQLVAACFYSRTEGMLLIVHLITNPTVALRARHHAAVQLARALRQMAVTLGLTAMALTPMFGNRRRVGGQARLPSIQLVLARAGFSPSPVRLSVCGAEALECGRPPRKFLGKKERGLRLPDDRFDAVSSPASASASASPSADPVASFPAVPLVPSVPSAPESPARAAIPSGLFIDRRPVAGKTRRGKAH